MTITTRTYKQTTTEAIAAALATFGATTTDARLFYADVQNDGTVTVGLCEMGKSYDYPFCPLFLF